jgi:drug/metabolite transporter (DMT)-like permease
MALSVWLFHEPLTATKLLGAAAILAGIVCLGLAERDEAPPDAA